MAKEATMIYPDGRYLQHTAAADIAVGDVVPLATICGIATEAIAKDATGTIDTEGVYEVAAINTAEILAGAVVYWDDTNSKATNVSTSNTRMGVAAATKASSGTTMRVKLNAG